jgi:hypothetical protein
MKIENVQKAAVANSKLERVNKILGHVYRAETPCWFTARPEGFTHQIEMELDGAEAKRLLIAWKQGLEQELKGLGVEL